MNTIQDTNLGAKLELLKGVGLFSGFEERALDVVARYSEFFSFQKGRLIFSEGTRAEGLYVISEGEVLITRRRTDDETVSIAQFIRGECFGEMDVLENRILEASAKAETDVVLLKFPAKGTHFQDMLDRHPVISARILYGLMAVVAGRIRNTNRLISENSQWVLDLKRQLYYDKLTGLFNRLYLDEELPRQMEESGGETSIIMIKPDSFKRINDEYGHEAGDRALRYIAYSIMSQVRDGDTAARYRGDEFAVILPGAGLQTALVFAGQMLLMLRALTYDHIAGGGFSTTVSAGVAVYPAHAGSAKELIALCFKRMFEARDAGGNRVVSEGPH